MLMLLMLMLLMMLTATIWRRCLQSGSSDGKTACEKARWVG
jgi:hypothetical protein